MNLKRLAEISPLIGAYLIFLGYGRLWLYYGHWNINIIGYLNFSEIALSFFNDLNIFIFFLLLVVFQTTVSIALIAFIDKDSQKHLRPALIQPSESQDSTVQNTAIIINPEPKVRVSKKIMSGLEEAFAGFDKKPLSLIASLFIPVVIFLGLFFIFVKLAFLYFGFICFLQFLLILLVSVFKVNEGKIILLISAFTTLLCFTCCLTWYEIRKTEVGQNKIELLKNDSKQIAILCF